MADKEDYLAKLAADAQAARDLQKTSLEQASQPRTRTDEQTIASSLIGLAPLILGAMSGSKRGRYAGGMGALAGQTSYEEKLDKDWERNLGLFKTQAESYGDKAKALENQISEFKGKDMLQEDKQIHDEEMKRRFGTGGTTVTLENKGETAIAVATGKELADTVSAVRKTAIPRLQEVLDAIQEARAAGIVKKDKETWVDAIARNVGGAIDPASPAGKLQRVLTTQNLEEAFNLIKGAATEPEQKRLREAGGAGWNVPLHTLEEIARSKIARGEAQITEVANRYRSAVAGDIDAYLSGSAPTSQQPAMQNPNMQQSQGASGFTVDPAATEQFGAILDTAKEWLKENGLATGAITVKGGRLAYTGPDGKSFAINIDTSQ